MPAGRPSKWEDWKDRLVVFQGMARDGATDEQFAARAGIGLSTWYGWKARYPELREAIKQDREQVDQMVVNALLKRALGYDVVETETVVTREGKTTRIVRRTKHIAPDSVAAFFWLKNRQPDKYRERRDYIEDKGDHLAAVVAAIRSNLNSDVVDDAAVIQAKAVEDARDVTGGEDADV